MSDRRNRPPNRWGCKPTDDVCVAHDMPLECRHGCEHVKFHQCADQIRIANAELLDALRQLADVSRTYIQYMDADDIAILKSARAAIAKATGDAQ